MPTATAEKNPISASNITELAKIIVAKYEAKKETGCEVCKGHRLMNDDVAKGMIRVFKDKQGNYRVMAVSPSTMDYQPDEVESRPINYCPNCGKKLKKTGEENGK